MRVARLWVAPSQRGLHQAFLLSFAAVGEPAHACFGLETPGPIRKRPESAEFPPVPPWPACVAVPLLALERRYPRAALGVFGVTSNRKTGPLSRRERCSDARCVGK